MQCKLHQFSGELRLMKNIIVTLTRHWPADIEQAFNEIFTARLNPEDKLLNPDEIIERCEDAMVLCPTVADVIDRYLIDRLPASIRLIANYGAGVERIDVAAANARGILVSNTPGVVVDDTADLTFGLIISASRRFSEGESLLRQGLWDKFSLNFMLGSSVHGKTLAIVGMGDIGTAVARRARGFNMHIIYHNRHRNQAVEDELGAVYCERLETLLRQADIVSLHCPLTPETHHLINTNTLRLMRGKAILINTARGPVVDETALIEALSGGIIAAAGLDVFEYEPRIAAELRNLKNTVLVPHLGTATHEARYAMVQRVIANIVSYIKTGKVINEAKG